MAGEERSTGTIVTTDEQKRAFAAASMAYNLKSKDFVRIFPELAAAPPSPQPAAASPSTFRSVALQFLDVGGGGGGGGGEGSSGSASPRYLVDLPQGMEAQLRAALPTHPDFPKPGILFIDVLPLWRAPALLGGVLAAMAQGIAARFPSPRPAFLAGLESRGFLLAPLALQLGLPFLCVRKAGKLPGPTERLAYALEYGEAVLEVQRGVVEAGAAGLLCDDLLATGGTLKAARALLERLGARVLGAVVLVELVGLKGAQNLALPVLAALTY
jgi:adenine phosphoribosyltransferase